MFNKRKFKNLQKIIATTMIFTFITGIFTTQRVEAHNAYFLAPLIDINSMRYLGYVSQDNANTEAWHGELKWAPYMRWDGRDSDNVPVTPDKESWQKIVKNTAASATNISTVMTFPATSKSDAKAVDREAAQKINSKLVNDLNRAITFILNEMNEAEASYNLSNQSAKQGAFFKITGTLANTIPSNKKTSFTLKGASGNSVNFTLTPLSISENSTFKKIYGSEIGDYLQIKSSNGNSTELRYKMDKYSEADNDNAGQVNTLTWKHIVYTGNALYTVSNLQIDTIQDVGTQTALEVAVVGMLDGLLNTIRTILGLQNMEDLMFARGEVSNWWKGIAPTELFNAMGVVFWVFQVLAWLAIIFAIAKLFSQKLLGTVSTSSRIDLIKGIQDILIAAFGLAMIYPVVELIATFNQHLVQIFSTLTTTNMNLSIAAPAGGSLGGIFISFALLGAEIYFNFFYILRGLSVAILYGISPLFVVMFAFGGAFKAITIRFIKELIGNIYVQFFHSVVLTAVGIYLMSGVSTGTIASLVVAYSFIPMTSMFKSLMGIGESGFVQSGAQAAKAQYDSVKQGAVTLGAGAVGGFVAGQASQKASNQENNFKAGTFTPSSTSGRSGGGGSTDLVDQNTEDNVAYHLNGTAVPKTGNQTSPASNGRGVKETLKTAANSKAARGLMGTAKLAGNAGLYALGESTGVGSLKRTATKNMENQAFGWGGKKSPETDFATGEAQNGHIGHSEMPTGGREHYYSKDNFSETGISNLRTTDKEAIATYSPQQVQQNQEFFNTLESNSVDGKVTNKTLRGLGVQNFAKQTDGSYQVAYNKDSVDVRDVRKFGNNKIAIQRQSSLSNGDLNFANNIMQQYNQSQMNSKPQTPPNSEKKS